MIPGLSSVAGGGTTIVAGGPSSADIRNLPFGNVVSGGHAAGVNPCEIRQSTHANLVMNGSLVLVRFLILR